MSSFDYPMTTDEHTRIMQNARRMQSLTVANGIGNGFAWVISKFSALLGLRPASHDVTDFSGHQMQDIGVEPSWSDTVDARRAKINADLALSAQ